MKRYTTHDDHEYIHVSDIDGVAVVCFNGLDRVEMGEHQTLADELQSIVDRKTWTSIILGFEGKAFIPWAAFEAILSLAAEGPIQGRETVRQTRRNLDRSVKRSDQLQ